MVPMACHCAAGWVCEQHPDRPWPHDHCAGPGARCRKDDCPWWQGPSLTTTLSTEEWDRVYASTRAVFRIVQAWGPNKARHCTVISMHATAAAAFAEIDRLASEMVTDAIELLVLDQAGEIVRRPRAH